MTENPKLENMGSDNLSSNCGFGELGEKVGKKFSVTDGLENSSTKSESFVVDMEPFSHLLERDITANSRIITLQRNLSRKGSVRIGEKKNERDTTMLTTSPRATLHGGSTPEKPTVVAVGSTDHSVVPQVHHQITITNGSAAAAAAAAESKFGGKRYSFRRSSPTWTTVNPRRILFFFATLSCMGSILIIYFTLSMGKLNGDDINGLNQ